MRSRNNEPSFDCFYGNVVFGLGVAPPVGRPECSGTLCCVSSLVADLRGIICVIGGFLLEKNFCFPKNKMILKRIPLSVSHELCNKQTAEKLWNTNKARKLLSVSTWTEASVLSCSQ